MTKLLEKAFKKASLLSSVEQNALAKWMIEEIESEKKWDETFADSEDILDRLADEALDAHKKGKSRTLNIDKF